MKKVFIVFISLIALVGAAISTQAQTSQAARVNYFEYPIVPDSITNLGDRCDFLLDHFWDFCDLKKAFSSKSKMREAFTDYISFMPYASADKVHGSIASLAKKLDKQPDDLLFLAQEAESQTMSDSCQYYSEEVFLDFAKAVVANKRIDRTAKLRYEQQIKQIGGTQPGMIAPELSYTDSNGAQRNLSADSASVIILYFSDPDCSECRLAKVQLDANIQASKLIDRGTVKVVCLTPTDYSEEWAEEVKGYPEKWTVGAAPDADIVYHIQQFPSFYLLDKDHKIHAKNYSVDEVLQVIARLDQRSR